MLSVTSKLGQEFQNYIDAWDAFCENDDRINKIQMLVDAQGFVMFFKYQDDIFGATEPSRVTFAKMMAPEQEDMPPTWLEDSNFMAVNLTQTLSGRPTQQLFKAKDLPDIEIIPNKEQVVGMLAQQTDNVVQNPMAGMQSIIQLVKSKI